MHLFIDSFFSIILEKLFMYILRQRKYLCNLYENISERNTANVDISSPPSAYKDLQSREDTRNAAWQRDGWDEVVYYTGESAGLPSHL